MMETGIGSADDSRQLIEMIMAEAREDWQMNKEAN